MGADSSFRGRGSNMMCCRVCRVSRSGEVLSVVTVHSDRCGTGASVFSSLQLSQAFLSERVAGGHLSGRCFSSVKLKGAQAPNLSCVNGVFCALCFLIACPCSFSTDLLVRGIVLTCSSRQELCCTVPVPSTGGLWSHCALGVVVVAK